MQFITFYSKHFTTFTQWKLMKSQYLSIFLWSIYPQNTDVEDLESRNKVLHYHQVLQIIKLSRPVFESLKPSFWSERQQPVPLEVWSLHHNRFFSTMPLAPFLRNSFESPQIVFVCIAPYVKKIQTTLLQLISGCTTTNGAGTVKKQTCFFPMIEGNDGYYFERTTIIPT